MSPIQVERLEFGRRLVAASRVGGLILVAVLAVLGVACIPPDVASQPSHLERARRAAEGSSDGDAVGHWLLLELVAPKGEPTKVEAARQRLAELSEEQGVLASLARGIDADTHGRFAEAAPAYLAALKALEGAESDDEQAPGDAIVGWFAANRLVALRHSKPDLYAAARPLVEQVLATPRRLGWRARGELVEWWSEEAMHGEGAGGPAPDPAKVLEEVARQHGCVTEGLLAGPFGRGSTAEHRVHFAAEEPGPWPNRFERDLRGGQIPRVHTVSRHACLLRPNDAVRGGVYYFQTFIDLDVPRDVTLAVQGAYALYIDDQLVLDRDMEHWGIWPRYGVRLRLPAGRHRVLARLLQPETSVRLLDPTGAPLALTASADQGPGYDLVPPRMLADPNALDPYLRALGVTPLRDAPPSQARPDLDDPVSRYLAAYLAHVDAQDDVASVIFEPMVKKQAEATPLSLAQQAVFIDGDPIFPRTVARDLARDLREQAVERDRSLWGPRLWLVLARGEKAEPAELAREMEEVVKDFPQVPMAVAQLARIYGQLGWRVERMQALEKAAAQFVDDTSVLSALLEAYEEAGRPEDADRIANRIKELDPTQEIAFRRALLRQDYDAAIAELRRIAEVRHDRRAIAVQIEDLLVRAGKKSRSMEALELALAENPEDEEARLALADARYAAGDRRALLDALVDALQNGADDGALRTAIELVDGITDLEPFRRDGLAVVKEAEASGLVLPGTAARILDYGALWVAGDGTARMLEHEIIRVQSREGIARHVEQQLPRGVILHMRTIKADGTILEPEIVAGKPTVTMPKLEVGDYIETEHILALRGASRDGRRYRSPRWFFREQNTSYHVSEFVIVTPEDRELTVETTGQVPDPTIDRSHGLTVHRWRVEGSVALPEEPLSAPVEEFLPSVRAGWGIDLDSQLRRVVEVSSDDSPRDPRMVRIAQRIVKGQLKGDAPKRLGADEKARRIYRWVLDTIQPGDEKVGPRIVTGKSGDRTAAFTYLARLAGLDARLGLVENRLSPPPAGPFSEAEMFDAVAVRVGLEEGSRWLMVGERFAPYGYLPSSLRGQPAIVIQPEQPITTVEPPLPLREVTSSAGGDTGIGHRAEVELARDGSAVFELTQEYRGRYAIQLRTVLNKVPESRRNDVVEAQLLGLALPGGKLTSLDVPNLEELDQAVTLKMRVEVPVFARSAEGELLIEVPFLGGISKLVPLPERETPLYIPERLATRASVELTIKLPPGATPVELGEPVTIDEPALEIEVADTLEDGVLHIKRRVVVPAGRVQPKDYAAFRASVLRGDEALNRKVRLRLATP
ncbi:MAG: hypothetical protein KC731_24245 [Myxococcales bacterium]|nr:hypothetical protein [Myxococcales bacterium]